jgi:uncharacterized damage-inducible protein DinB
MPGSGTDDEENNIEWSLAEWPQRTFFMSIAETLLLDYDFQITNTRRTLERVPEDRPDWAPHPKSMPLGKLAMHCATLPLFGAYILEDEGMDMANSKHPRTPLVLNSREEALKRLEECSLRCRAALEKASDDELSALWKFSMGERMISSRPRAATYRTMFFDHLVHHTAQLGMYLRLNDIPVPGLYGPSADEPW